MSGWYAEDLEVGMEFSFGTWPMTEADIIAFAKIYDPQPMHIDPPAAANSPYGGIIASGLQTMSIYQALLVEALWNKVIGKAGKSLTGHLRRPVRPGMTLSGKVVCEIDADAVLFMRPTS